MNNVIKAIFLAQTAMATKDLLKGTATTSRYWDCTGGACGCGFGKEKSPSFCHSNAMFVAPKDNKWKAKYYGTASISKALGGGKWNSAGCGKCFKVSTKTSVYSI
jgi:hypothetical protein